MPQVHCARCGEELLGSVNRCWKCGHAFVAEHNPENLPPIRRRPIPLELVNKTLAELHAQPERSAVLSAASGSGELRPAIEAEVVDEARSAATLETASHDEAATVQANAAPAAAAAVSERRLPAAARATPHYAAPPHPAYPTNAGATGGAIAAVVLGVMSLAALRIIAPGALLVSILGVSMGVWGLHSDRRGVALFGLVLCCLAMALAGFFSALQLFELINGYNPFDADLPPIDPNAF